MLKSILQNKMLPHCLANLKIMKVQYQSFNYKRKIKPPVFLMELHHLNYHNSSVSNSYTLPEIFIWNSYPKIVKKKVLMSLYFYPVQNFTNSQILH